MKKFHINKKGDATECKASIKSCPLGGEHFNTKEEAQASVAGYNQTFTKIEKKVNYDEVIDTKTLSDSELDSLNDQTSEKAPIESIDFMDKYETNINERYGENKLIHGWEVSVNKVAIRGKEYYAVLFDDYGDTDEDSFALYDNEKAAKNALKNEEMDWIERHGIRL